MTYVWKHRTRHLTYFQYRFSINRKAIIYQLNYSLKIAMSCSWAAASPSLWVGVFTILPCFVMIKIHHIHSPYIDYTIY